MTFQIATQSTDLDRVDNIRAAVTTAPQTDADTTTLITAAQSGDEAATLELIARHEPRIRAVASEFRVSNGSAETDRQQAALVGFLTALAEFTPGDRAEFFTFAHSYIRAELSEANRTASPVPVARTSHALFFAAMRAADNDPAVARRWAQLQCLSIAELEPVADEGGQDAGLSREIIDHRVDVYERHMRRGYVHTGRGRGDRKPVPEWQDYREQAGRGLAGHTFDTILAAVSYESLDAPRFAGGDWGQMAGSGELDAHEVEATPIDGAEAADPFTDVDNGLALGQMLATLDDREQDIIRRHLDGETDRVIATALGLSRPRVVNIRAAAIDRMRRLAAG